jgi:hypothetical protein
MRQALIAALLLALHAGAASAADAPAGWQHYAGRGFAIEIPPGWKADPGFLDRGYGFFQGQSDDVRGGTAFTPPDGLAPGTNLEANQLKLVVQMARPGDLCVAAAFLVDQPPDFETRRVVNEPERVRTIGEPGDLFLTEQAVILASTKPCVAVHYFIVYAKTGGRKPVDREQLFQLLGTIAATVTVSGK